MQKAEFIVVLSFRTFGDYVLRTPFLYELFRRHVGARIVVVTNRKGAMVYPLLDSRLEVITLDHDTPKFEIVRRIASLSGADLLYAVDVSRTTLVLGLLIRARCKVGWYQNESWLYRDGGSYLDKSVAPWLSRAVRFAFTQALLREPEARHDAEVELQLLGDVPFAGNIASYRSSFGLPAGQHTDRPFIYCSAEAGWIARQLTSQQWLAIILGLLASHPNHDLVIHAGDDLFQYLPADARIHSFGQRPIQDLFKTISASSLVIAADSFALHIASLYNVPAIGYFGPARPHRFRCTSPNSVSLFHAPSCSPCLQHRGDVQCQRGLSQCESLSKLDPAAFVDAARMIMNASVSSV